MAPFWHLAIESSGLGGSVALFQYDQFYRGKLHSQLVLPTDQGSVRTLTPAIDQLLRDATINPSKLDSLSVTSGPGSFTGLRVGLTTAKMLAWTANIPVAPVDTLAAIALRFAQSRPEPTQAVPVQLVTAINAFRRQVFTSSWTLTRSNMRCELPSAVVDVDQWLANPWQANAHETGEPVWVSGGAIRAYHAIDSQRFRLADTELWQPLAEQVGYLGLTALAQGQTVSAEALAPNYIRSSAAEENAKKRPASLG